MQTVSVPAPVGGWNARDPLDAMQPTDAITLVNWFPQAGAVYGRGGSVTKVTLAGTTNVDTLCTFTNITLNQLIAGTNGKLYTVDPVAVSSTQIGTGFTNNQWQTGHFNNKLVFVNGADQPQVWDGTTLSNFVGSLGVPVVTVAITSTGAGTVGAGIHGYRVSALFANSTETTASTTQTVNNAGATNTNTVSWQQVGAAVGYKVYGRTSGGELLMATINSATTLSFVDDGSVTPAGALPASDTSPKNLLGIINLKGRAAYWANAICGWWYSAAGAFQGSLSYFPMDFLFLKGGYIAQIVSWSRDNHDGVDDMTAFISSNGEMIVYQGTDPSNALTWSMVGRFHVGAPLNVRSHGKIASQEIILTSEGFAATDEAIATQGTQNALEPFAGKICRAASAAGSNYPGNFGWECLFYPRGNMFLINVPISTTQFEQYVKNTDTGAWCRFTGLNARTWTVYKNRLYYGGTAGQVVLADTDSTDTQYGWGDNGVAVLRECTQAYVKLSQFGTKSQVTAVQIVSNNTFPSKASINFFQDYQARALPTPAPADNPAPNYWDVPLWDTVYWGDPPIDPTVANARTVRYSVRGYGFAVALSYRLSFKLNSLVWYSTTYEFKQAGV